MAFATGLLNDIEKVGAGEVLGSSNGVLTFTTFEDGLTVGRFAKLDTGSIDNIDASVTPVIAGVVVRNVANKLESASTIDSSLYSQVQVIRDGYCTVDVKTGDTPTAFGDVFVHNAAGAEIGKATTTDDANTEPSNAEFIQEVKTGVWVIRLK